MGDLTWVPLEDLVTEIQNRTVGSIIVYEMETKVGDENTSVHTWFSGSMPRAIGLAEYGKHTLLGGTHARREPDG